MVSADSARAASSLLLLQALLTEARKRILERNFVRFFDHDWTCVWPRTSLASESVASLIVGFDEGGHMNLQGLVDLVDPLSSSRVAKEWGLRLVRCAAPLVHSSPLGGLVGRRGGLVRHMCVGASISSSRASRPTRRT